MNILKKWVDFREGRKRYKVDRLGSLYIAEKWSSDIPTIFIGGQMEHRRHIIEQRIGHVPEAGYAMFDGCFASEYPINEKEKSKFNAINFSSSLLAILKEAGIKKVNLMTESYGGTIGAYASPSDRIHKVVAVHPPILGSPLAWPNLLSLDLTARKKIFAFLANVIVDSRYGFQKDKATTLLKETKETIEEAYKLTLR